jgi:hypothetical protein
MPSNYHTILFWLYWAILAWFTLTAVATLLKDRDSKIKATAAMLLVPAILRLLLIK